MPTPFSYEIGAEILRLVEQKKWKICYEFRNFGDPDGFQSMEEVFEQRATVLEIGPRYHIFPGAMPFDRFSMLIAMENIAMPRVTIADENRYLFGFGLRDDYCYFVTNSSTYGPTADREPKEYDFMLDGLKTLEEYSSGTQVMS